MPTRLNPYLWMTATVCSAPALSVPKLKKMLLSSRTHHARGSVRCGRSSCQSAGMTFARGPGRNQAIETPLANSRDHAGVPDRSWHPPRAATAPADH